MTPGLSEARARIRSAQRVVFLTGAGVSAESGIPTFRDSDGMWESHSVEELATPEGFERDPRRVWEWYLMRRKAIRACRPNPGHEAIARFMSARADVVVVTQNIDSLHHRALRVPSAEPGAVAPRERERILELHGNILRDRCSRCDHTSEGSGEIDVSTRDTLPRCPACDALLRPDVVWFGELLDPAILERAFEEARRADVCVVAGTSAVVHPAASVPLATLESGGSVIEVNPEVTPITQWCTNSLRGASGTILPELLAAPS